MKKEKNLDELFREKLLNYEQEPPAYLLENILDGVAQNRRKKRMIWWRVAGVAAALLLAFVAGWQLNDSDVRNDGKTASVNHGNDRKIESQSDASEIKTAENRAATAAEKAVTELSKNSQNRLREEVSSKSKASGSYFVSATSEHIEVERPVDDFSILKPMKGLLVKNEKNAVLQEKKLLAQNKISSEKTIDQQIMELNSQMLATQEGAKEKASWSFGAQVSPEYNGYQSSHNQAYASNMLKTKATTVDLAGGVSIEYKKSKRWSFQSGIYYSGIGQTSGNNNRNYSYAANDGANYFSSTIVKVDAISNRYTMNSNAGVVELTQIPAGMVLGASLDDKSSLSNAVVVSQNTFVQDFDYLEVPLYLRYNLVDRKFGISMLGGLSSNILVGNRLYVDSSLGKTLVGRTRDLETFNYSGTLGLGFKYGLTNRLSLNVEPRFKYFLNSLSSNSSVSYKPYTFGVYTGLSYEF